MRLGDKLLPNRLILLPLSDRHVFDELDWKGMSSSSVQQLQNLFSSLLDLVGAVGQFASESFTLLFLAFFNL